MQGKGIGTVSLLVFCVLFISNFPFLVCDLYFAYNNPSQCLETPITKYSVNFTLKTWLQVDGFTLLGILAAFLLSGIISFCSDKLGVTLFMISLCSLILFSMFRLAWMIIGAVMFWGDLDKYDPKKCDKTLSDYMYALLIISFIGVFCNLCTSYQSKNKSQGA